MVKFIKNVAFVGVGRHALEHLIPALLTTPGMNFYAAYSSSKDKLVKIKKLYNIEVVTQSLEVVLNDPKVDAIAVSGSPSFHYEVALLALKNKKHVFIEKPPATKRTELVDLLKIAKQNNVSMVVGYNFSRGRKFSEIKSQIGFERVKNVNIQYISKRPRELQYHYENLIQNGLYVLAIHPFHLLISEFGEIEKLATLFSPFRKGLYRVEHFIKFKSGKTAAMSWGNYLNRFLFDVNLIDINGDNYSVLAMRDLLFSSHDVKNKGFIYQTISPTNLNCSLTGYQESWDLLRQLIDSNKPYLDDIKNTAYIFDVFEIILNDLKLAKNAVLVEHDISRLRLIK
jgi:predicted dehydrogenase